MKIVIVGGVAGGATAAARIRRLDEQAEIVVFERSGFVSYANCGLPYYIGDVITDRRNLTLQTPENFFSRFQVTMKVRHEVTAIHPKQHTVSVKNLETGEEFEEKYDKLLLSPGAKPTQPSIPGTDIDSLFTLRTVEDTLHIKEYIDENHPKSAVLAGGGFIGLELAENLRELGMEVTIVQRRDADGKYDQISLKRFFSFEQNANTSSILFKAFHRMAQCQFYAVPAHLVVDESGHVRVKGVHQLFRALHDGDLHAQFPQVLGQFQSDEAAACQQSGNRRGI